VSSDLLRHIDDYMDAVPRAAARAHDLGPLRLFVKTVAEGWPYYARPIPNRGPVSTSDVDRMRARQRALGVPETYEWIVETSPALAGAAAGSGLEISSHPLMAATTRELAPADPPAEALVRMATRDDDLSLLGAVAMAGFGVFRDGSQATSGDDVERARASLSAADDAFMLDRLERGITLTALAKIGGTVVAVGSHQPVGSMSEIVGVATLPAYRRRGLGTAITWLLADDARSRGIDTVVLSAGDRDVARMYERVGFSVVGSVGAAAPPG